jgi:hypothetical protein
MPPLPAFSAGLLPQHPETNLSRPESLPPSFKVFQRLNSIGHVSLSSTMHPVRTAVLPSHNELRLPRRHRHRLNSMKDRAPRAGKRGSEANCMHAGGTFECADYGQAGGLAEGLLLGESVGAVVGDVCAGAGGD